MHCHARQPCDHILTITALCPEQCFTWNTRPVDNHVNNQRDKLLATCRPSLSLNKKIFHQLLNSSARRMNRSSMNTSQKTGCNVFNHSPGQTHNAILR